MSDTPVTVVVQSITPAPVTVTTGIQGPAGPAGPTGPPGEGDMQSLIYDPSGVRDNCFNLANLTGNFDAGTF